MTSQVPLFSPCGWKRARLKRQCRLYPVMHAGLASHGRFPTRGVSPSSGGRRFTGDSEARDIDIDLPGSHRTLSPLCALSSPRLLKACPAPICLDSVILACPNAIIDTIFADTWSRFPTRPHAPQTWTLSFRPFGTGAPQGHVWLLPPFSVLFGASLYLFPSLLFSASFCLWIARSDASLARFRFLIINFTGCSSTATLRYLDSITEAFFLW